MKIAVIGSGIAGLGAAWALDGHHEVTLFEAEGRLGGHTNTVTTPDGIAVDTGFIVYNEATYPNLTAFFSHLGVATQDSDMSFGCSIEDGRLEYCGDNLLTLFAQKRNLLSPRFHQMWRDILRFYREAPAGIARLEPQESLGELLRAGGYSTAFIEDHLLPMGAAIWSSTESEMEAYPAEAFVRFFKNHKLVKFAGRPRWSTVKGGSRSYVARIVQDLETAGVKTPGAALSVRRTEDAVFITGPDGREEAYDEVILACHSDEALLLLADADETEEQFLGAIPYAKNVAVLHRDESLLPRREAARAAWCYLRDRGTDAAAVTYDMNRLQGIDPSRPLLVTLNPGREPDPALTFGRFEYDHPQFTAEGMAVQRVFNRIQGVRRTWFAGAWLGYGFHEDGLRSGLRAALRLGGSIPWEFADGDVDGGPWVRGEDADGYAMAAAE